MGTPKPAGPICNGVCGAQQYQGDGNCDDENNNCGCKYDGGDCCPATVTGGVVKKNYCTACKCLDPQHQGKCSDTCGVPKYKGDGNCDDENNNCGCAYDGGDCCGLNVKTNYCTECKCKDPLYNPATNGGCGAPKYKGDGNCDDENNNPGCAYDGGDCCAKSVTGGTVKTSYCKECKCKDPANQSQSKPGCEGSCGEAKYKGDGNCDDNNNSCGCDYDGGDCCAGSVQGGTVKTQYCKACKCLDPKFKNTAKPTCGAPKYKGDGNCDDENNNPGCLYDDGDCCAKTVKGGKVLKTYCKDCACKDPKGK